MAKWILTFDENLLKGKISILGKGNTSMDVSYKFTGLNTYHTPVINRLVSSIT